MIIIIQGNENYKLPSKARERIRSGNKSDRWFANQILHFPHSFPTQIILYDFSYARLIVPLTALAITGKDRGRSGISSAVVDRINLKSEIQEETRSCRSKRRATSWRLTHWTLEICEKFRPSGMFVT